VLDRQLKVEKMAFERPFTMLTRRKLLTNSATVAAISPFVKLAEASTAFTQLKPICIRTIRVPLDNLAKAYSDFYDIGYRGVEGTYEQVDKAGAAFQSSSLRKMALTIPEKWTAQGQEDALIRCLDQIKKWGFVYALTSSSNMTPDKENGLDKYLAFADRLNRIGEKCRAAGLGRLLYHNQVYEFTPVAGTTGFRAIMDRLDKNLCGLHLDVYWAKLAGNDIPQLLRKLSGRVEGMYLKDQRSGLPVMYEHPPGALSANVLDLGSGDLNWSSILSAAISTGVQHFVVEPEGEDIVEGSRKSWAYLSKLSV
jgi:sugar phosphate isomerase/epimerase